MKKSPKAARTMLGLRLLAALVASIAALRTTIADDDQPDATVERARKTVKMLDDIYKRLLC